MLSMSCHVWATAKCQLVASSSKSKDIKTKTNGSNSNLKIEVNLAFFLFLLYPLLCLIQTQKIMSQPSPDHSKIPVPETKQSTQPAVSSSDYAPYPKLDPHDVSPPPENWGNISMGSQSQPNPGPAPIFSTATTTMPAESNPYVSPSPVQSSSVKSKPTSSNSTYFSSCLFRFY